MATERERKRFIPFTRAHVNKILATDGRLGDGDVGPFEELCRILQSLYHFEFHDELEALKDAYRPFNPDTDYVHDPDGPTMGELEVLLQEKLEEVLEHANFEALPEEVVAAALEGEGLFPISLDVPFEDFERYALYALGEGVDEAEVEGMIPFTKKRVTFEYYEYVVMILKLRDAAHFEAKGVKKPPGVPGKIYLKYLKGVPKADLEMVFPDTSPKMKLVHKLKIGVPLAAGVAITVHKLFIAPFVMGSGTNPFAEGISLALVAVLGGLVGYVFKAYSGYKSTVQTFLNEITTSLYFKNMVNNQGVFTILVDNAEEEETKEAVIAYCFLLTTHAGVTGEVLDGAVERWLEEEHGVLVDFDVADALRKLEALGLASRDADGRISVVPLDEALRRLDEIWDTYFEYNR